VKENQAAHFANRFASQESLNIQFPERERERELNPRSLGFTPKFEFQGLFDHNFCFCVHLTDKWRNLRISRSALLSFREQLVINSSYKQHLRTFLRILQIPLGEREN
jgi:hypothetical protein